MDDYEKDHVIILFILLGTWLFMFLSLAILR